MPSQRFLRFGLSVFLKFSLCFKGYGWIKEVGHIDFYPNGGKNQPGCPTRVFTGVISAAYHEGFTGTWYFCAFFIL